MNKWKGILAAAGIAAVFAVGVACGNGEAATTPAPQPAAPSAPAPAVEPSAPVTGAPAPAVETRNQGTTAPIGAPSVSGIPAFQMANGQTGIWVTGEGTMSMEPDLVLLNVGVESTAGTVAEANQEAANAMDAIVNALRDRGLEDEDIQTRFFNISPQYEYREVVESGIRTSRQVLVGYRVNNSASIKIRDMDAVGQIIDEVAAAGGDATRINGVNFTVEDPKPLMTELREMAVMDAMTKAQQFADLTNVSLGKLVFISEGGATTPVVQDFGGQRMAFAEAAPAAMTPVVGGELELSLNVQAVFAIQ